MRFFVPLFGVPILIGELLSGSAYAGPPFKTDDPQPVDFGHWEFYLASVQQFERDATSATAPHLEVNYGAVPNVQLHLVAPMGYVRDAGGARYGYADTEVGVKYRFLQETDDLPQIGLFPLVEIPTGDESRGLGAGKVQAYLPLWMQKSWGRFTTYAGAGWWYNPVVGGKNWLFTGWEAQYDLSDMVTLGGEVYYQTADNEDAAPGGGFGLGGFINVTENHHILFSAGEAFAQTTTVTAYLGYQLTI